MTDGDNGPKVIQQFFTLTALDRSLDWREQMDDELPWALQRPVGQSVASRKFARDCCSRRSSSAAVAELTWGHFHAVGHIRH